MAIANFQLFSGVTFRRVGVGLAAIRLDLDFRDFLLVGVALRRLGRRRGRKSHGGV